MTNSNLWWPTRHVSRISRLSISHAMAILWAFFSTSCSRNSDAPPPDAVHGTSESGESFPAGNLMDDRISFEFAIYYLPKPSQDPIAEIDRLLKDKFPSLKRVEKIDDKSKDRELLIRLDEDPKSDYAPPGMEMLQRFGRGIGREQAEALQNTEQAIILDFAHPKEHVWEGLRSASELTDMLARSTGGLIWDEATREVFSPDAWKERRLADWKEEMPNVSKHTVIHAYKKDEYVRAVTLGMEKFGLPDVVVENFPWSMNNNMGNLVVMFTQAIAEQPVLQQTGEFDLNFKAIKNSAVREAQSEDLKPNATSVARLVLKKGTWEEGDPQNRLIEIAFDRGDGPDPHAKQDQIIGEAFGWEDEPTPVKHDEEIDVAIQRARANLPALKAEFSKGLAPGEFIQLKAPFDRPDGGNEWMWVEVSSWQGDKIEGLLKNEPYSIPTLHAGQVVEVSEAEVIDYIRRHPDGSSEGNETGKVIEKRSK